MEKEVLEQVKEKVVDLAQTGLAKSIQLKEMAKYQISNVSEEDAIKKAHLELGKLYMEVYGDEPEVLFAPGVEKIKKARAKIQENNQKIKELRNPDVIFGEEQMPKDVVDVEDATTETETEE